jgi:hypothetical protein
MYCNTADPTAVRFSSPMRRSTSESPMSWLALQPPAVWREFRLRLSPAEKAKLPWQWRGWRARPAQLAPEGDWRVWLILAGRGFGKTRAGAEWVREQVESNRAGRIALVGETLADVRDVMIEGESGLLAISPPDMMPLYEPSKRRLSWPNGAIAKGGVKVSHRGGVKGDHPGGCAAFLFLGAAVAEPCDAR